MVFKSSTVEAVAADRYSMTGDLTIKGNTRPVTLTVVNNGEFRDPMMGHRIGYGAETRLQRRDFGLNIDTVMDGRLVLGNEIQITIEGELVETANEPAGATR
jgi:polyisoprenoid-binding protein YceI